jgi:uncharacterized BrkB/YihY/UPF0761 family membrane protein
MSEQPPPAQPIEYARMIPPDRPTSVTVLSIIGIIFAVLGFVGTAFALVQHVVQIGGQPNPAVDVVKENGTLLTTMITLFVLGLVLSVILLAGSILSMKCRAVGRQLMLTYVWFGLVQTAIGIAINYFIVYPAMLPRMRPQLPPSLDGFMYGTLIAAGLLGAIYPLCVLYYFTRPHVRAALSR